jgi:hypothetical protein
MGGFLRSLASSPIIQNIGAAILLDLASRLSRRSAREERVASSKDRSESD